MLTSKQCPLGSIWNLLLIRAWFLSLIIPWNKHLVCALAQVCSHSTHSYSPYRLMYPESFISCLTTLSFKMISNIVIDTILAKFFYILTKPWLNQTFEKFHRNKMVVKFPVTRSLVSIPVEEYIKEALLLVDSVLSRRNPWAILIFCLLSLYFWYIAKIRRILIFHTLKSIHHPPPHRSYLIHC